MLFCRLEEIAKDIVLATDLVLTVEMFASEFANCDDLGNRTDFGSGRLMLRMVVLTFVTVTETLTERRGLWHKHWLTIVRGADGILRVNDIYFR